MSSELFVPINKPLEVSILISETKKSLQDLLQLSELPQIQIEAIENGGVVTNFPLFLNEDAPALNFFFKENNFNEIRTQVYASNLYDLRFEDDEDDTKILTATASMSGGAGTTRPRFVMVAACAIALARQANSIIQDYALRWGNKSEYEPESLLNLLKCKKSHSKVEAAFEEVLENIERAKIRG